jgi:nucleoside-diphosphate-sugar epimerase
MKYTPEQILKKRAHQSHTILLTGATGFLGSNIACHLIKKGHKLILLARANKDLTPTQRFEKIFHWFGLKKEELANITIFEAALEEKNLGLETNDYHDLLQYTDEIIHSAAATSFSERHRAQVERTNLTSLLNILTLAQESHCYFFHHISTAYVAGRRTGICQEELGEAHTFYNVYEETKYLGEKLAIKECEKSGIRLNIYRPSIVYGDSKTGRSNRFNALYYPIKSALFLKEIYERDIHENNGKKALEMGVKMEPDGYFHLPLRLTEHKNGMINLVPIDYFTKAFYYLMQDGLSGRIYHITSHDPARLEDIMNYFQAMFKVSGIITVDEQTFTHSPKNPIELLFDSFMDMYWPYMYDTRSFDSTEANRILSKYQLACPNFSYEIFYNCMDYALKVAWGKKLYDDKIPG